MPRENWPRKVLVKFDGTVESLNLAGDVLQDFSGVYTVTLRDHIRRHTGDQTEFWLEWEPGRFRPINRSTEF